MYKLEIIGLGAGDFKQMPLGIYERLKTADHVYVRTEKHPLIPELVREGLTLHSFDYVYEQEETFADVYEQIVVQLKQLVRQEGELIYAVPGHPLVAERTVQLLLEQVEEEPHIDVQIIGGHSFLDPLWTRLQVDPNDGFLLLDGTFLQVHQLQPELHTVITQVYDQHVASEVKLTLMEVFTDDHPVQVLTAVGMARKEQVEHIPLYELDRVVHLSNLTAVYVPPAAREEVFNRRYERARHIVRTLRGPDGCPWDRRQTHHSLSKYFLEEVNEVVEAIEEEDPEHLQEELGDVLLQIFMHAQIAEEDGLFNMEDVLRSLNEKMIRRHPHVFGDAQVDSIEELDELWQQIKAEESRQKEENKHTEK